jgi:signal transduction histidine kinase
VAWPDGFVVLFWICWAGLLASLVAGAAALVARYRAGDAQRRRQVLWLAYGAVLLPLWLGGGSILARVVGWSDALDFGGLMILQVWPAVAVAVAVTRHGLYAIDRLFTRTLVYVALTAGLVATYAAVALLAGLVAGGSALSASLATLAAALLFLPLRDRLQRAVDRRFAKARFDAVRRLRDFLEDVREGRAEPENVGGIVALALEDPRAEIIFRLPATGAYAGADGAPRELPDDGRERSPIGRDLGVLLHSPAPPDLLRGVLQAAAVPVELARLRLQLAEVESSRARIAQAGYEERRRIERDLHDGAQQRLVTLGIVLRRLQRSLPREARLLGPSLDAAVDEVAGAIGDLRTLAAGVRPPRLDDGLAAALADLARGAAVPVNVAATADRAPPEVEATAYFVACEALTNAVKHAAPTRVSVETTRVDGVLRMTIADDGVGGASVLRSLRDRVAAQGGTLVIDSPPGAGTRIAVELPCGS